MSLTLARLGIIAGSFPIAAGGDFESIATVTVGSGGASSIDFTAIPGTYQHLHLRISARITGGGVGTGDGAFLGARFNSDSGSNYAYHGLLGNGSSGSAGAETSQNTGYLQRVSSDSNTTASHFGAIIADILDYSSTSKNKTVRVMGGSENNGSGRIYLNSFGWFSTAAVTSITLTPEAGTFKEHSTIALYGVRA